MRMYPTEQFCEDLIREILVKLPVKTLMRFKQVSKTWHYIITSHQFAKRHYYHSVAESQSPGNKNPKSFFLLRFALDSSKRDIFITSIRLTDHDPLKCTVREENIYVPYIEMIDRYHHANPPLFSVGFGLFCIFKFCIFKFWTPTVALWNPWTREVRVLPLSPFYDIKKNYRYIGVGHAEYEGDVFSYKVGLIHESAWDWRYFTLELYNSSTNSWKLLICDIEYKRNLHQNGVNFKGTLHLLSVPGGLSPYIITFDYNTEVFGRMEVPAALPQITGQYDFLKSFLTLYDDRFLCLVIFWTNERAVDDNVFFDVWVMRDYGVKESWSKESTKGPIKDEMIMLNYWKSIGGLFLMNSNDGAKLCLCNCASPGVTNLPVISNAFEYMYFFEHMESLVSINGTPDESRTQKWRNSVPRLPRVEVNVSRLCTLDMLEPYCVCLLSIEGHIRFDVEMAILSTLALTLSWIN
ncbi:hypothetical protein QQ045_012029 [Rhodiola kirilowii]